MVYEPRLDEIKKMQPREPASPAKGAASQAHEEWTETVRVEGILGKVTGPGGVVAGSSRLFTLPSNPGTELMEVIITLDRL